MSSLVINHPPSEKFTGEHPPNYFEFKYPLDHFQLFGCQAIEKNENLLVTAHTGSGKTVLALYAIARCIAKNQRVIYISPIKTLSNQKYKEFGEHFESIGILTGDIKINPDAQCLIMTAEILRNFLTSPKLPTYFSLDNVTCVVLDEVHFINNQDRGRVWEEILLYLQDSIQLVMLSATLSEPIAFVEWIANLKKTNCHLVGTVKRPVPLCHYVYWEEQLHCFLKEDTWQQDKWSNTLTRINKYYKNNRYSSALFQECLSFLEKREMLPATVFLLNRDHVEKQASTLYTFQKDYEKVARIEALWSKYLHKYTIHYQHTTQWNLVKDLVLKGIGIHHSGMIPILKEMVEILYTEGLLPVLLATETFALGVNAPTKTTVFTNLQKFDGVQKRNLYSEEYNQMAGRAGRRGLDPSGTIVILPHRDMISETMLKNVVTAPPKSIQSRLSIDFSVAMNTSCDSKLNQTLFYKQQNGIVKSLEHEKHCLKVMNLNETQNKWVPLVLEILECQQKLQPDGYIRLDKKLEKKYKKRVSELLRQVPENDYKILVQYHHHHKKQLQLDQDIEFSKERWDIQMKLIQEFLKENGFIVCLDPLTYSEKGVIMGNVHDGNSLLMAEVLTSGILNELPASILVAMLSLFVVDKEREPILLGDNLTTIEKSTIQKIQEIAALGNSKELEFIQKLPFAFSNDYEISKTMYQAVKHWYDGGSWQEIKIYYGDFEGNFIKNILRLANYLQTILNVAKMIHNIPLQQKLENVQEKLIRDIVMNDSLYITTSLN
jgi:superfamily II RNA helicase